MSNLVNFLGSSNGALGPMNIYVDAPIETGDTGSSVYLGGTQGATLRFSQSKSPITYDQYGTEPANQVITGEMCELECNLVQTTLTRLAQVLQEFTAHNSGADGFTQASAIGQDDLSVVLPLKLVRVVAGVDSTDPDDIVFLPAACPTGSAEWAYDASSQRVLNVKFRGYKSTKYVRASDDSPLWIFSLRAVQAGHVQLITGEAF